MKFIKMLILVAEFPLLLLGPWILKNEEKK